MDKGKFSQPRPYRDEEREIEEAFRQITQQGKKKQPYQPKFAQEQRDLALVMSKEVTCGEIEAAMKGMLAPKFRENVQGHAEVRNCIHVPNVGTIAGSYVQDGKITRQSSIRIVRDGVVIFEDKISSLRRFKDDVKEVNTGYECGVGIEKFNDIRVGDTLEAFIMEEVKA